jgi:hypothetical protein
MIVILIHVDKHFRFCKKKLHFHVLVCTQFNEVEDFCQKRLSKIHEKYDGLQYDFLIIRRRRSTNRRAFHSISTLAII